MRAVVHRIAGVIATLAIVSACASSPVEDATTPDPENGTMGGEEGALDEVEPGQDLLEDAFPHAVVRDCASSIHAGQRIPQSAMDFGPVVFNNMAEWLPAAPPTANEDGRYPGLKYGAGVPDSVRRVALVVSEDYRDAFALLYDRSAFRRDNHYDIDDGHHTVIFEPCETREVTWFNGGFLVAEPQCAAVDVYVDDELDPTRILLPFQDEPCE